MFWRRLTGLVNKEDMWKVGFEYLLSRNCENCTIEDREAVMCSSCIMDVVHLMSIIDDMED